MSGVMGAAAVEAGASLLGGLLGGGGRVTAGENAYSHVKGIMKAAEKYKIHPATLLGSVGAVGSTSTPNTFGDAVAQAGSAFFDASVEEQRIELEKTQLAQKQQQIDELLRRAKGAPAVAGVFGSARGAAGVTPEHLGDVSGRPLSEIRPVERPSPTNQGTVPVYTLSGGLIHIPRRVAERNKLQAFDVFQGGDAEEVMGEVGGQLYSLPHAPGATDLVFGGVTGKKPLGKRTKSSISDWWASRPDNVDPRAGRARGSQKKVQQ